MSLKESLALLFLYGVAGAACLGWTMHRARRGNGLVQHRTIRAMISALLPLLPLGALCARVLPAVLGLTVFSGACLLWALCVPSPSMLPARGKAVLITGCDSGFGYAFAKHLDTLGFKVFAGVLDKDATGPQELTNVCSSRLSLLQLDVTNTEQINDAYEEVQTALQYSGISTRQRLFLRRSLAVVSLVEDEIEQPYEVHNPLELWGIVHNAGVLGYVGDGELLPLSVYEKCMEVNYFGPVRLTKAFLPLLRMSKGRLVCISSMAGLCPVPGLAAYGSAKAALTMFSGVMRLELSKWGIKVATVYPSGFKTSIYGMQEKWADQDEIILQDVGEDAKEAFGEDYIRSMKDRYNEMINFSSSDLSPVLRDVAHSLLAVNPKCQYTPGKSAYIIPFIFHHLPLWIYDGLARKTFKNSTKPPKGLRPHRNQAKKYQ